MMKKFVAFNAGYVPARLAAVLAQREMLEELRRDQRTAEDAKIAHAVDFGLKANAIEERLHRQQADGARADAASVPDLENEHAYQLGRLAGRMLEAWVRAQLLAYVRASAPSHPGLAVKAAALVVETNEAWKALSAELARLPLQERNRRGIESLLSVAPKADATKSTTFRGGAMAEIGKWIESLNLGLVSLPKQLEPGAVAAHEASKPMPVEAFLRNAKELAASGTLETLLIAGAGGRVAELARCPELTNVVVLRMSNQHITDADIQALAASPYVGNLRLLSISQNDVGEAGLEAIAPASSTNLRSLDALGFDLNKAQDPADREGSTDGVNRVYYPREEGLALEAKYGPLKWLHFQPT